MMDRNKTVNKGDTGCGGCRTQRLPGHKGLKHVLPTGNLCVT